MTTGNDTDKKVDELISALEQDIVDEAVDLAQDALWDDGQYSGPGESLHFYHRAYVLSVLRWFKTASREVHEGGNVPNPPRCEYLQ